MSPGRTGDRPERSQLLLALGIGALVGAGIASTWLPHKRRRRRRLPHELARGQIDQLLNRMYRERRKTFG